MREAIWGGENFDQMIPVHFLLLILIIFRKFTLEIPSSDGSFPNYTLHFSYTNSDLVSTWRFVYPHGNRQSHVLLREPTTERESWTAEPQLNKWNTGKCTVSGGAGTNWSPQLRMTIYSKCDDQNQKWPEFIEYDCFKSLT